MKKFALATTLLALIGLTVGCAPADDAATPAAETPAPPIEGGDDMGEPAETDADHGEEGHDDSHAE